ncbi:GSCFA domain-containing protein [Sungkyunkwania multivorans]|uniref:GSCFA domain-containing protein n=1 Tax=Sungkyunkwania multivorans TaxID=1173618 RepID=A0ABW3D0N9_9FLAO
MDYDSKVLLLGSCFVENIGAKLNYFKFRTLQNPFGILFHPLAIEKLISRSINQEQFVEKDTFFLNGRWHCFDAHSILSDVSKEQLLQKLNTAISSTHQMLHQASHIVLTLGTSWAYRHIESDHFVANCHKVPQKRFLKELLSVTHIEESIEAIAALIKSVSPDAQIIFTVSPVRHLKDGFVENQRSKAHLLTAIHEVIHSDVSLSMVEGYFPSYEIMMDELRDYRFYEADMLHPNQTAIDYIWERFQEVWIAHGANDTMKAVEEIQRGMQHRPFDADSEQHQQFLYDLEKKKTALREQFPHMVF